MPEDPRQATGNIKTRTGLSSPLGRSEPAVAYSFKHEEFPAPRLPHCFLRCLPKLGNSCPDVSNSGQRTETKVLGEKKIKGGNITTVGGASR